MGSAVTVFGKQAKTDLSPQRNSNSWGSSSEKTGGGAGDAQHRQWEEWFVAHLVVERCEAIVSQQAREQHCQPASRIRDWEAHSVGAAAEDV